MQSRNDNAKTKNRNHIKKIELTGLIVFLTLIFFLGIFFYKGAMETNLAMGNISPNSRYLFGTDWLGRDMLKRTFAGLSISMGIGTITALISTAIAVLLGCIAAMGNKKVDAVISYIIDLIMGIPHILLLLLISFCLGKGVKGVVIGIAVSHWPTLARVIRSEILQVKNQPYIHIAYKMGNSKLKVAFKHILPHILPQIGVGFVLLFPHAILHEASITFLGFGLDRTKPAIGIILSESMEYLITGKWWLALFPGVLILLVVVTFERLSTILKGGAK